MPSLESLHRHFKDQPFELLAIDVGEEKTVVSNFIQKRGITFPNLLDLDKQVSIRYGVRSHPMKFLIDSSGNLIGFAKGYREWDSDTMKALINKLIQSSSQAGPTDLS